MKGSDAFLEISLVFFSLSEDFWTHQSYPRILKRVISIGTLKGLSLTHQTEIVVHEGAR